MFLPFAALVLAGIGSWHLVALGKQVTVARQQYLMMLGDFRPTWLQETKRSHRIRDIHLEMAAPRLLFFGTLALSIANVYVILRMTLASLARSTDEYIFGRELIWTFPLAGLLVCTGLLVFGLRAPLDPASERPPVA